MFEYDRKQEESRQQEYDDILDEDRAHEERKELVKFLDSFPTNPESLMHMFNYYDEIVIENMAKGLKRDPKLTEDAFQIITELITELRHAKDELYRILDV